MPRQTPSTGIQILLREFDERELGPVTFRSVSAITDEIVPSGKYDPIDPGAPAQRQRHRLVVWNGRRAQVAGN